MSIRKLGLLCCLLISVKSFGVDLSANPDYKLVAQNTIMDQNPANVERRILAQTYQSTKTDVLYDEKEYVQFSLCVLNQPCEKIGEPISVEQSHVLKDKEDNRPFETGLLMGLGVGFVDSVACLKFKPVCMKLVGKIPLKHEISRLATAAYGPMVAAFVPTYIVTLLTNDGIRSDIDDIIMASTVTYPEVTAVDEKGNEQSGYIAIGVDDLDQLINKISAYQVKYLNK